jgi:hypothetical protein
MVLREEDSAPMKPWRPFDKKMGFLERRNL